MIYHFDHYNLGNRIVSVVKSNEAYMDLQSEGVSCVYIENDTALFWPDLIEVKITDQDIQKLEQLKDYDVIHIHSDGRAHLVYDVCSRDQVFVLTERCNSNCLMCPVPASVRRNSDESSISDKLDIIGHMPSHVDHITITGGEPMLIGDSFFDFMEAIQAKYEHTDLLLLTNGRALSYKPYFERFVKVTPKQTLIGIPIHGHDAMTHDRIVQVEGAFEQTCRGIRFLIQNGFRVELRIVVSRLNAEYITQMADLICDQFSGAETVKVMGLEMLGNAAVHSDQVWLSYRAAFDASKDAIHKFIEKGIDVALYNFPLCAVDRPYHILCRKSITDYKVRYTSACQSCKLWDACGGIFAGTLRFAEKDIRPWSSYVELF